MAGHLYGGTYSPLPLGGAMEAAHTVPDVSPVPGLEAVTVQRCVPAGAGAHRAVLDPVLSDQHAAPPTPAPVEGETLRLGSASLVVPLFSNKPESLIRIMHIMAPLLLVYTTM